MIEEFEFKGNLLREADENKLLRKIPHSLLDKTNVNEHFSILMGLLAEENITSTHEDK